MSMMDLLDMDELGLWMPESNGTKIGGGDIFEMGLGGVQDEFIVAGMTTPDALDNLLFPQQLDPLPQEDEWMERLDMTSFMGMGNLASQNNPTAENTSVRAVKPNIQVTPPKPCRLRLLQELLLQGVPPKMNPASPEAQVAPDLDTLDSLTESPSPSVHGGSSEITPEISFEIFSDDPMTQLSDRRTGIEDFWDGVDSINSANSASGYSLDSSFESSSLDTTNASTQSNLCDYAEKGLEQSFSPDDLESIMSGSAPSSPCSEDPDYQPSSVQSSPCKRKRKSRHNPYSTDILNRKDKKKLQNKNAAIRYRMKKKAECDSIKHEEDALAMRNNDLRDKVDQINREIKYMKDLMSEVYKAKRIKIESQRSH